MKKLAVYTVLILSLSLAGCSLDNYFFIQEKPEQPEQTTAETIFSSEEKASEDSDIGFKMTIYTVDPQTEETVIDGNITVQNDLPITDKLQAVANELSARYYNGLGMIVTYNEDTNIANIDLIDDGNNTSGWYQKFQGSAGAYITERTLVNSFLQPLLSSNWIDGFTLTHNGVPFEESDHFAPPEIYDKQFLLKD